MSGGSFSYLCAAAGDGAELIEKRYWLGEMADFLDAHFPDSAASKDTRQLLSSINLLLGKIGRESKALEQVWHAIEWWQSLDWSQDRAVAAVDAYRRPQTMTDLMTWVPQ